MGGTAETAVAKRTLLRALRPRSILLWILLLSPALAYAALGAYALWATGYIRWIWWWLPVGWSLAWLVNRVWRHPTQPPSDAAPSDRHWTPRDHAAAAIVQRYQQRVDELTPEQLTRPHFILY